MTMSIVVVPSFILLNPLHGQTTETEHEMETFQLIDGGEENAYRSSAWKGTVRWPLLHSSDMMWLIRLTSSWSGIADFGSDDA